MATEHEVAAMRRALDLAIRGPVTGPNPRVGCVILDRTGVQVGAGWHDGAGTDHAEVMALGQAGARARGGTAVVTLEPCHHTGRTGPCTAALRRAGVTRVVIGALDPNPVAAGGARALAEAGISVDDGVLAEEAAALNRRWSFAVRRGRPFVTWKFAASLDGRSAAADGSSRWITGEESRADVHRRRAEADAVLVGTGTVIADDPWLTVRDGSGRPVGPQPVRVVVGQRDLPSDARVLDAVAPTLQLRTRDLPAVLADLHGREIRHVWLEGGPTLAAAFLRAGLVDEVLGYFAPVLLGDGFAAVGSLSVPTLALAPRLRTRQVRRLGDDVLIVAEPLSGEESGPDDGMRTDDRRPGDRKVRDTKIDNRKISDAVNRDARNSDGTNPSEAAG
jgi:diaminohydroxyphosphoribosylaminopyrimidine deaminase / 5-amino-6-(5-phosphoribosylamino)uracil reductase